jgi:Na+/H+ antiporter NhaC
MGSQYFSFQAIVMLVCAAAYYRTAEVENVSGILWAGMSVGVYLLTWLVLGWGYLGNLIGQALLLGGITIYRAVRDSKAPDNLKPPRDK